MDQKKNQTLPYYTAGHLRATVKTYLRRGAFSSISSRVSKDDLWEMRRRLQKEEKT